MGKAGRTAAWLVGSVLVIAGTGAIVLLAYLVAVTLAPLLSGRAPKRPSSDEATTGLILAAVAIVAPLVGGRLMGARRRLALFLRRFGRAEATHAVTYALHRSIGGDWRLVSLDDAGLTPVAIEPVGVRSRNRNLVQLVTLAWVGALGLTIWWFSSRVRGDTGGGSGQATKVLERVADWVAPAGASTGTFVLRATLILVSFWVVIQVLTRLAGRLINPLARVQKDEEAAEAGKRISIDTEADIVPVTRRMIRRSRRFFSPQLFVVRVAGPIWQPVVRRFAGVAAAVVVDISEASENVLWEIETLRGASRGPWIFVGQAERVEAMRAMPTGGPDEAPLQKRLADALAGHDVILYGDATHDLDRFADELRRAMA